jgi:hypothetical protein
LLADRNPAFGTAAIRNFQLMRECTHNGLLYGGPHYFAHGVPPCVHHTFTHAKALTTVLNETKSFKKLESGAPLPREIATGVKEFPEIDTSLAAFGPWRATISGSDWLYHDCFHATGGALATLYHEKIGPVFVSSLAKYIMAEPNNMQPLPDGVDFPLAPRVEMRVGDKWYTNLYDLTAKITCKQYKDQIKFEVETRLVDEKQQDPPGGLMKFSLAYALAAYEVAIWAEPEATVKGEWSLVLPVISKEGEKVTFDMLAGPVPAAKVEKPDGWVILESNASINHTSIGKMEPAIARDRVFNLVPGMQAVPFVMEGKDAKAVICSLRVLDIVSLKAS